ncbi:hypothetical protein ACVV4A_06365 [Escherichia coli]
MIFEFHKVGEEELVLADELKETLRRTREALAANFDQQDPQFVSLKDELERLFKKRNSAKSPSKKWLRISAHSIKFMAASKS